MVQVGHSTRNLKDLAQTQMQGTWLVMGLEILLREVAGGFQVLSLRRENLGGSGSYTGKKNVSLFCMSSKGSAKINGWKIQSVIFKIHHTREHSIHLS